MKDFFKWECYLYFVINDKIVENFIKDAIIIFLFEFSSDKAFCVSEKPVTGEIIHSSDELQYLKMQRERNEPYTILNRNNETYTTIYNIIE